MFYRTFKFSHKRSSDGKWTQYIGLIIMYMPCTCANLNWQLKLQLVLSSRRSDSWMDTTGTAVGESKPIAGLTHCSISLSGLIA